MVANKALWLTDLRPPFEPSQHSGPITTTITLAEAVTVTITFRLFFTFCTLVGVSRDQVLSADFGYLGR